jgi:hypothetical protein
VPGTSSETTRDNLSIEATNLVKAYSKLIADNKFIFMFGSVHIHMGTNKNKNQAAYVDSWNGNYSQGENGTNGLRTMSTLTNIRQQQNTIQFLIFL